MPATLDKSPRRTALVFVLVVAFGLAQVAWWTYFQFREVANLDEAARLLQAGEPDAAARALGASDAGGLADHARRRRIMFASEGAFLSLCVLVGVVFFYLALVRERRMRRAQSRFLTGATHELKTPLATMRLGLQSLLDNRVPEAKHHDYFGKMLRETERLERGISNILTAAGLAERPRARRVEIGDLADDVRSVAAEMAPRFAATNVALAVDELESIELSRDPVALRCVIQNLLDNGAKFSTAGGRVDVSLTRDGGQAVLAVRDQGVGMRTGDLERATEPFYRGEDHEHIGGSGLGLYLARQLIEEHDGDLLVHSDGPGRGTVVELRLPVRSGAKTGGSE